MDVARSPVPMMAYRRTGGLGLPPADGPALGKDVPASAVPAVFTNSRRVTES